LKRGFDFKPIRPISLFYVFLWRERRLKITGSLNWKALTKLEKNVRASFKKKGVCGRVAPAIAERICKMEEGIIILLIESEWQKGF
jgi:hypothetical protein